MMTGMVIQVQSSRLPQNGIKAQSFTAPNAICVRKVITVMISCLPKISLRTEDRRGPTPKMAEVKRRSFAGAARGFG